MPSGGKREGAGRKKRAEKFEAPIAAAEQRCADRLAQTITTLEALADGGQQRVLETWEPAGTILIDATEIDYDAIGNPRTIRVKKLAFPNKKKDELVLVKRVVETSAPDLKANIYLADRVMGKPTERHEIEDGDDKPFAIVRLPAVLSVEQWQQQAQAHQQKQPKGETKAPAKAAKKNGAKLKRASSA